MKEEIFTINDIVIYQNTKYTINSFSIIDNKMYVILIGISVPISIKDIKKAKQPLFTTKDGVDIYDSNYWFYIFKDWSGEIYKTNKRYCAEGEIDLFKSAYNFSTKEAAEEYILMNKPCLSINDVLSVGQRVIVDEGKLKQIVKNKLNENK
jgi:hypothetical protein